MGYEVSTGLMKQRATYALATLRDSWVLGAQQFLPLLGAWALSLGVPVAILLFGTFGGLLIDHALGFKNGGFVTLAMLLLPGFLIGGLYAGWALISLKVARGMPCKISDLVRPLPQALSGLAVLCITSIFIGLGSFLVIPGALLFLKWQLAPYYIVDRGYGPMQALRQSWHDTDRIFIPLAILDLIFVGISALAGFTIIGPIACHMALAVASALVYSRWLTDESNPEFAKFHKTIEQHDETR